MTNDLDACARALCHKAADEIEARGWTKEKLCRPDGTVCLLGGILAARYGTVGPKEANYLGFQGEDKLLTRAAELVAEKAPNGAYVPDHIVGAHQRAFWFNDRVAASKEEVTSLLRSI